MALDLFEVRVYRQELRCDECDVELQVDPAIARESWMAYFYRCPKCGKRESHGELFPRTIYVRKKREER